MCNTSCHVVWLLHQTMCLLWYGYCRNTITYYVMTIVCTLSDDTISCYDVAIDESHHLTLYRVICYPMAWLLHQITSFKINPKDRKCNADATSWPLIITPSNQIKRHEKTIVKSETKTTEIVRLSKKWKSHKTWFSYKFFQILGEVKNIKKILRSKYWFYF